MILNFKTKYPWGELTHFVGKILNWLDNLPTDQKLHSIRTDKTNRWKPGMKIHFSTGMRTKNYKCFAEGKCILTQVIEIREMSQVCVDNCYTYEESHMFGDRSEKFLKTFKVIVDGRDLTSDEIDLLAKNDGFETTHDFFRWFNKNFTGKIIHWTDLKY